MTKRSDGVRPRRPNPGGPGRGRLELVASARRLIAQDGPAEVLLRAIADAAGFSHSLITQQFGSKTGLLDAVAEDLGDRLDDIDRSLEGGPTASVAAVVAAFRHDPDLGRLTVRSLLEELPRTPLTRPHNIPAGLATGVQRRRDAGVGSPDETSTVAAYALSALVFGLVTFDGLLTAGSQVESVPTSHIDTAMVETADVISRLALVQESELTLGPLDAPTPRRTPVDLSGVDARTALVLATTDLYAQAGGASLSTRAIAERAGVKQGLIYHYFESREHLLSVAIEEANQPLQRVVPMDEPVDLAAMIVSQHQLPSLRIIARLLVNGVPIRQVRKEFPVFRRLLAMYRDVPDGADTTGLSDPRLAVFTASAMGLGMSLWDNVLRECLGLPASADLVTPSARISARLLAHARPTA